MLFKLIPRFLLFAGLGVCLTIGELWLRNTLASNTGQIVFTSRRDGNLEIYMMDSDGTNQKRLTAIQGDDLFPAWSPDGTKIAFVSNRNGGFVQIHVMDADGKNPIRLTDGLWETHPEWSPDGQQIAFTVNPDFQERWVPHIAVIDADGDNRVRHEDHASEPSWSPDGQQIAFTSWRDDWNYDIYVIGANRQGLKRVTHDLAYKARPSFSPDGGRIAYMSLHGGFFHIYVVGADGTNRKRITHNEEHHGDPAWSPDGQTIAYVVSNDEFPFKSTIHLMTADGQYLKQLSDDHNASDDQPNFSPLGLAVSPASKTTTTWGKLKKVEFNRP